MLKNKLQEIIKVLDKLIKITNEDISNIKEANHDLVFKNMSEKEKLAREFQVLKFEIDTILSSRNLPIESIFSKEEEVLFEEFKEKLSQFNTIHKRFSKLALSVANFYNALYSEIYKNKKVDYSGNSYNNSYLHIKA